jgi:ABC-type transport system substrate-binding protein
MTYTKNPNYWKYDEKYPENILPYIDEVKGVEITERASWLAGMRTGKIDYIGWQGVTNLNNIDEKESLERTNPELVIRAWSERSEASHIFNIKKPPFDDVMVRRAMQMALDLETINATYFKYSASITPRGRLGLSGVGYYVPFEEWSDELKGYYTYDPEGAEKLLDAAGLPRGSDGVRFEAEFLMNQSSDASVAQIHAEYWRAIGADVKIVPAAGAEYGSKRNAFEWNIIGWIAGVKGDPVWQTSYLYSGRSNFIEDSEYDGLYEQVLKTTDTEALKGLTKQLDMRMIDQHWVLWGGDESKYSVWQPYVVGYNLERGFGAGQNYVVFSRLWIDSQLKAAMGR